MNDKLVERIREMDDFRLLRFFDNFGRGVVTSLDLNRDQLLEYVEPIAQADPDVARVLALQVPADKAQAPLDKADAVIVARSTLEAMASNPGLAPGLETALAEFKDDEMPAMTILALGFAVSMIIMAATTKLNFSVKDGKWEINGGKEVAPPEMIKEIVRPLASASARISAQV